MRVDSEPQKKVVPGKKPTIHNVHLLDRSGSMATDGKYKFAEGGINEEINILKKDDTANYTQTIIEFDGGYSGTVYNEAMFMIPMKNVGIFKGKGANDFTPLYEAIAYTINKIIDKSDKNDRILLKIFTDGAENHSRNGWGINEGGAKRLFELIQKVKNENNLTVTFVGTIEDTENVIHNLGIDRGNTLSHDNTGKGTRTSFMKSAGATIAYANTVATEGAETVSNFYSKTVEE